jgi:polar amino acid transport system substrate-binding protein
MGKKMVFSLLVIFGILSSISYGEGIAATLQDVKMRGKLLAGVKTSAPPFGFVDEKGVIKGLDIDIAKNLANELFGKEDAVEFIAGSPENRIVFLNTRKTDIIVGTEITDEHKKIIDFSIPYFISGHLILVHERSKITKYQDLAGKKVGTIQGTTGDTIIKEIVPSAERIQFHHYPEVLQALKDGRVDAFVEEDSLLIYLQHRDPDLKIASWLPFQPVSYGLGIRKGNKEWLDFVNATLTKMEKTGKYEELLEKWFGEARAILLKRISPLGR